MKHIKIPMLIMLLSSNLMAQSITLSGRVVDGQSAEPQPYAKVTLFSIPDTHFVTGTTSDPDGAFLLGNINRGTYLVRVSMYGYQSWEQLLSIERDIDLKTIQLSQFKMLAEVTVTAMRPIFTMEGEKNIYNTADDPSIQNGSVVDALQNAPGIEVDAEGDIRLRGTQEVSVWINGRECRMNPEALKQYLKTLPANSLKRIEVITNPSARYGGDRPVVNIVTQGKSRDNQLLSFGINGSSKPEIVPWISYIFNNEKWEVDLYANFAYLHDAGTQVGRESLLNDSRDTSRTDSYTIHKEEHGFNALVSADVAYHPDSLTSIYAWGALMPTWSWWNTSNTMSRNEYIYNPGNYSFQERLNKKASFIPGGGFMDGIWYERTLDEACGSSIMAGYYGSLWYRDSLVEGIRQYDFLPQNDIHYNQHHKGNEWFHCMEISCLLPLGKKDSLTGNTPYELDAGGELMFTKTFADVTVDTLSGNTWSRCQWLSSITDMTTTSGDIYASLLRRWRRLSVKGGIRLSLQHGSIIYPDDTSHSFKHNAALLTPSIHLTYNASANQIFSLGYTYRISAPSTANLTTRQTYTLDDYTTGNPLLLNSSTHHLELKWDRYKDGMGAMGFNAFCSALTNSQATMIDVGYEGNMLHRIVTFRQPVNIGNSCNSGVDFHVVYRPNAFVNVRFNSSLFYYYQHTSYRNEQYTNGMWCYLLRLNAWVTLKNKLQFFGNAYYNSPTQNLFSTTLSRKGVDIGINADLWDRRFSLNLGINDLFDWNKWSTTSANPYLQSDIDLKPIGRYVSFSLTCRLGHMDLEGSSRRAMRQKE